MWSPLPTTGAILSRATVCQFCRHVHDPTWLHPDHRIAVPAGLLSTPSTGPQTARCRSWPWSCPLESPRRCTITVPGAGWCVPGAATRKVYRRWTMAASRTMPTCTRWREHSQTWGHHHTRAPRVIFTIETISSTPSISIHVLGNDIGCVHRHRSRCRAQSHPSLQVGLREHHVRPIV